MTTSDLDAFKAAAAGLLARRAVPQAVPRPSAATPRHTPAHSLTTNTENTRPRAPGSAAVPITTPITRAQAQPAAAPSFTTAPAFTTTAPALTERDTNIIESGMEMNKGPLLRGDPQALMEAREFMQNASQPKTSKSRSRTTRSSTSSTTSSPRVGSARALANATNRLPPSFAPTPRLAASIPRTVQAPTASFSDFSALHSRPSMSNNTSATPSFTYQQASAPAAALTTSTQNNAASVQPTADSVNDITSALEKTKIAEQAPKTPLAVKEKATNLLSRQLTEITKTANSNSTETKTTMTPPHLRRQAEAKAAKASTTATFTPSAPAASAAEKINPATNTIFSPARPEPSDFSDETNKIKPTIDSSSTTAASKVEFKPFKAEKMIEPAVKTEAATQNKPAETKLNDQPAAKTEEGFAAAPSTQSMFVNENKPVMSSTTSTFTVKPSTQTELKATSAAVVEGTKTNPIVINGDHDKHGKKAIHSESDQVMSMLATLKHEVAGLNAKIQYLELDNEETGQQLQVLKQADERRRLLGTDNATKLYNVHVSIPSGTTIPVQVTAELRILDLVRRTRTKANIAVAESKNNPRITFRGEQIGHSMTLGEVCIGADETVTFTYDAAEEDEEL